ncbi:hypothetical protein [Ramlibacter albus]|uniref:Uncharacterized protein n=1 Tax=Ramlibacter albus TaxID=2079448 RepID=A0A923MBP2_9BURK|nr:hypothetical protein [Ramlibacter albus]MBC5766571.1 hypothetical protein [Ramlibacter albus]
MNFLKRVAVIVFIAVLSACTTVTKLEGEQVVHDRLAVRVPEAWNKINDPWSAEPYDTWTQEGLPLDQLRLWGGVKSGDPLVEKPMVFFRFYGEKDPRVPTFRAGMSSEKLVNLFEQLYANAGAVRITKVEPTVFAGEKGVRFEFALNRRGDDLQLRGVGWLAVKDEKLYAATFMAPQLHFFGRILPMAEAVVNTARIKG